MITGGCLEQMENDTNPSDTGYCSLPEACFIGHYILVNGDIPVSAMIKTPITTEAEVELK